MSTHTSGPWRVHSGQVPSAASIVADIDNGITVIVDGCKLGAPESDARLIAAAPDLKDALEAMLREFTGENYNASDDYPIAKMGAMRKANEALNKARGQS